MNSVQDLIMDDWIVKCELNITVCIMINYLKSFFYAKKGLFFVHKHEAWGCGSYNFFFKDLTQLCMLIFSATDHNWIKHSAKQIQCQIAIIVN